MRKAIPTPQVMRKICIYVFVWLLIKSTAWCFRKMAWLVLVLSLYIQGSISPRTKLWSISQPPFVNSKMCIQYTGPVTKVDIRQLIDEHGTCWRQRGTSWDSLRKEPQGADRSEPKVKRAKPTACCFKSYGFLTLFCFLWTVLRVLHYK